MLEADRQDWLLDEDGDLDITDDLQFSTGLQGIQQACVLATSLQRGELRSNLDDGMPFFERDGIDPEDVIIGERFDEVKILNAYREALLDVDGVTEIVTLTAEQAEDRTVDVAWQTRTVFGDTEVVVG